jgi:vitamin B12 transporter
MTRKFETYLTFASALALLAPRPCQAAPPASVSEVVVTATRLPSLVTDEPDVRVIDRTEIDARQAVFAADVLDTVPGLAVTSAGAFGGVTSVRMRGASSDKTLVLIDGVPQNDTSQPAGGYDFSTLDLADVERIEILSGPQGSLWGSDAIGGVIALTTREIDGARVAAEGGSLDTVDGSAAVGKRTDAWALGASVSGFTSNGVSKADGLGQPDPFWNVTAGAYGRWTPVKGISLDAHFRYDQSRTEIDGYDATTFAFGDTPGQTYRTRGWTGTMRAQIEGPWGFHNTLTFGEFDLRRSDDYPGQPFSSSAYWASRQDYRWLAERGAPEDAFGVAFGVERNANRASLSTGEHLNLGTTSGFGIIRWRPFAPLTITGSGRYDAPDSYSGAATGRVAAVLRLGAGVSVEGAWGQGFKTPTISEIACDFCFPAGPSVGLKPEHAEGWDAGLAWRSQDGRFYARVRGFRLDVRDQITYVFDPDTFASRYQNVGRARSTGVEAEADAQLTGHLKLELEYGYTDAVDLTDMTRQLRIPRNAGSATLFWRQGRWDAALTVRSEGRAADADPSTFLPADRPGFTLVSLAGGVELARGVKLTARVENLGDVHYQEVLGYGEPRRMVFFGLRAEQ